MLTIDDYFDNYENTDYTYSCPECGNTVERDDIECPECGYRFGDPADVSEIDGMISDSVSGQLLVDSAYNMPDSEDLDVIMDEIMKEARNEA